MKQKKNERRSRPIKDGLEEDINRDYTWSQVKTICELYKLDPKEFSNWMNGQTCPMLEVDGKRELGYYGYDLFRWLNYKKEGKAIIWD